MPVLLSRLFIYTVSQVFGLIKNKKELFQNVGRTKQDRHICVGKAAFTGLNNGLNKTGIFVYKGIHSVPVLFSSSCIKEYFDIISCYMPRELLNGI
ncbi:hypothetical protein AVL56_05760 [Alteromonas stellipolaris]|nr:hypothetical protein AVL56_05760 [Alteromonas stellipolaris]